MFCVVGRIQKFEDSKILSRQPKPLNIEFKTVVCIENSLVNRYIRNVHLNLFIGGTTAFFS